jgi:hypothetical protein
MGKVDGPFTSLQIQISSARRRLTGIERLTSRNTLSAWWLIMTVSRGLQVSAKCQGFVDFLRDAIELHESVLWCEGTASF